MKISHLDHLVLTVANVDITCEFYTRVLGMEVQVFGEGRKALGFGNQKINLHQKGKEFEPKSAFPTTGSADLCFILQCSIDEAIAHLEKNEVGIIEKKVFRTGALGSIESVYFRDPDLNLIECSVYP